jgi:allophanate hydrolase
VTVWISRRDASEVAADVAAADPALPLAGLRLAVKDNIDVAGLPTTAGCPAFAYEPASDAVVVARLRGAGVAVVGKTNLDQFATGLVGTRSPYGAVESPLAPGRVAGGSSSGSAAAVALGEADIALGTDTAGSGRVPAAFCGIVGLKPTRGWLPTTGVVPACASLDCVSVFARDVAGAAVAVEAAAGYEPGDPWSRRPQPASAEVRRIGRPSRAALGAWCAPDVLDAFDAAVDRVDLEVHEVDLTPFFAAGALLYDGALVAERHVAVGAFVDRHPDDVDPVVGPIIAAAGRLSAPALAADLQRLAGLRRQAEGLWERVDALIVPTAPSHPTLDDVAADPVGLNRALGRFTNGVNLLDWCAAAVPAGSTTDGGPFGVSLLGPAWTDRAVWAAAAHVAGQAPPLRQDPQLLLAVCGAHLEGQPLHHQLVERRARLVARTTTAAAYRMVHLATDPAKPGMVRVPAGERGAALEVEVWALDAAAFGTFVAAVPSPLTIGTVELADGTTVKGFLCEPHAAAGAEDISSYGGWRSWLARSA